MRDGISIGWSDLLNAVQAGFDAVSAVSRRRTGAPHTRIPTTHAVGAGESPAHEEFRVKRECPQMSSPFFPDFSWCFF